MTLLSGNSCRVSLRLGSTLIFLEQYLEHIILCLILILILFNSTFILYILHVIGTSEKDINMNLCNTSFVVAQKEKFDMYQIYIYFYIYITIKMGYTRGITERKQMEKILRIYYGEFLVYPHISVKWLADFRVNPNFYGNIILYRSGAIYSDVTVMIGYTSKRWVLILIRHLYYRKIS